MRPALVAILAIAFVGCPESMERRLDAGDRPDTPPAVDAPSGPPDAPVRPDAPVVVPDAGAILPPRLGVGVPGDPGARPADYGCSPSRPVPGATTTVSLEARGFASGDAVAGARLFVQTTDDFPATCGTGCIEVTTDALGRASLDLPAGAWVSVHAFPHAGATMASTYVDSRAIHVAVPTVAGPVVEASMVSLATLNLIPAAFGFTRVPGTAVILGRVVDCDGAPIHGALVRVFAADGTELAGPPEINDAPHIQYFDGAENPDGNTTWTQADGLSAGANLPVPGGETTFRVEAWGVVGSADPITRISCETIALTSDGVGIVPLGPLRADYPAGDPCAP